MSPPPEENPFASRYVRPGALSYCFPPGDSAEALVRRFIDRRRRGAIVGRHGTGKSTLLAALSPVFSAVEMTTHVVELHDGQRRPPRDFDAALSKGVVLVVDGYEQLGCAGRLRVWRAVRRTGAGLLVTAHEQVRGLPTIAETVSTVDGARELVARLAPGNAMIVESDVVRLFAKHDGNIREVLFGLYDLYESRRRCKPGKS